MWPEGEDDLRTMTCLICNGEGYFLYSYNSAQETKVFCNNCGGIGSIVIKESYEIEREQMMAICGRDL